MKSVLRSSRPCGNRYLRMPDDILLNKGQIIRRCLARVREEYGDNPANLVNPTKQDSIVINIQRACEAAIDLAMHFVAQQNLGIPQTSREAFTLLQTAGILTEGTSKQMRAMVGFRNIAVHNYQTLEIEVLQAIIQQHLGDFDRFLEECGNKR
jgi:uncharacterized protein YutE (UPF0331/DUF86 family)